LKIARPLAFALLLPACGRLATSQAPPDRVESAPSSPATASPATVPALVVHMIPLGSIPDQMVEQAALGLRSHAPVTVVVEPRATLGADLKASIRERYRADKILEWMDTRADAHGKWMGVTDVDIVARKGNNDNWGVLGLGAVDGRCSILSIFRMQRRWENGGAADEVVKDRLWKTAVHELGHTLGLPHCPTRGCIMEDAHGTVKTTDRETDLCADCQRRFRAAAGL
jgi:archaemetzincin